MLTQTLEQFGQSIKAKYPQYKEVPDADLGQKMLKKYPQYKDRVSSEPTIEKSLGIGETAAQAVKNVPSSFGRFFGGIAEAVTHPVRTAKTVAEIGVGGVQKFIPGKQKQEETFDSVIQFYKERYGGIENVKKTIAKDPIGFLADASFFITGPAAILTKVGQLSKLAPVAKAGQAVSKVARAVEPTRIAGKIIGKPLELATKGREIAPFGKALDIETIKAAQARGVELPVSAKSVSPFVTGAEALAAKGPFGGKITRQLESANARVSQIADDIVTRTSGSTDLVATGKAIKAGFDSFRENYLSTKSGLYKQARIPAGRTIQVPTPETNSILSAVIEQKSRAAKVLGTKPADLRFFENLRKGLTKKGVGAQEITAAIREIDQKIRNFNDPISTGNQATLKKIFATLSDEVDRAIIRTDPALAKRIAEANKFYQEGIRKLDSSYGNKIVELADQPDKIMPAIINPATSVEDVPRIYQVVGPEAKTAIQASFLEDLFAKAKGVGEDFTPAGIAKIVNRYGEDKLRAILEPDQFQAVMDLSKISMALGRSAKVLGGSQTAFLARTTTEASAPLIGLTGALATGNPLLFFMGLGPILGDAALAKLVSSPFGQKLLTEGFQLTGSTGKLIQKTAEKAGKVATPLSRVGEFDIFSELK